MAAAGADLRRSPRSLIRAPLAAAPAAVLLGALHAAGAPRDLVLTLALGFAALATVAYVAGILRTGRALAFLLGAWIASSALGLWGLYSWDRAGDLWFRVTGLDWVIEETLETQADLPSGDFLDANAAFLPHPRDPRRVVLPSGRHHFDRTLVIPHEVRLEIEAGSELLFGPGRSLIAYGTVIARGTPDTPIRFGPASPLRTWGVVAVVDADRSVFEHVILAGGRRARVNGLDLPGELSLIHADANLRYVRFLNAHGRDALYVRGGRVTVWSSLFLNARKDGVDFDGGQGIIAASRFIDCGDEGLDLSGDYDVEVLDNDFYDEQGGRVSADRGLATIRARNRFGFSHELRDAS